MEARLVNSLSGILRDRRNPIRIKQGIVAQRLDVGPLIFCSAYYFVPLTTPRAASALYPLIGVAAANVDRHILRRKPIRVQPGTRLET
jgi:hypothetical protein